MSDPPGNAQCCDQVFAAWPLTFTFQCLHYALFDCYFLDGIRVNPPDLISNSEQDQQTAEQMHPQHPQSHPQHDRNLSTDQSQQYFNPYQGEASPQYKSYQ